MSNFLGSVQKLPLEILESLKIVTKDESNFRPFRSDKVDEAELLRLGTYQISEDVCYIITGEGDNYKTRNLEIILILKERGFKEIRTEIISKAT
mgnify:CR=1 FL=1